MSLLNIKVQAREVLLRFYFFKVNKILQLININKFIAFAHVKSLTQVDDGDKTERTFSVL